MKKNASRAKNAEPRWDLSVYYDGINDPQIDRDEATIEKIAKEFHAAFKGQLDKKLGPAIAAYSEIEMLGNKIGGYLALSQSVAVNDEKIRTKNHEIMARWLAAAGEYLEFFNLEIANLPEEAVEAQCASDPLVAFHRPWLKRVRMFKPYNLSEPVESALTKRAQFATPSWSDFYDVVEADLHFPFHGKKLSLEQIINLTGNAPDGKVRAAALKALNDGLKGSFVKYSSQTLNMIVGAHEVERRERGYAHAMSARNLSNFIPDQVVDALHEAVKEVAVPLARRYYRLKAAHLGRKTLRWSDRNAPISMARAKRIPYDEALAMVEAAYRSFSPTLADIVKRSAAERRIDAPTFPDKQSGAFNMSMVLPGRQAVSWTLLNYQGSERDVMTLAHELGHGAHGILAGEAQGPLMQHAPMAYAETASVFGEMTVFNDLRARRECAGDEPALLAMLMKKIDDFMNTCVRQISFSEFEKRVHAGGGRRLSPDELCAVWQEVTRQFYGPDGKVFTYENTSHLWSYVSHFHRPFYVYSYAFGELLTQSLYAKRPSIGDRFEPLYVDLLKAGGTKDAVELLKPFGLDPGKPRFWADGIVIGAGKMIQEAEELSRGLGVKIK